MSESTPPRRSGSPPSGPGYPARPDAAITNPVPRPWQPTSPRLPATPQVDVPQVDVPQVDEEVVHDEPGALHVAPARRGHGRTVLIGALTVLALTLAGTTGYLYRTSHAWQDRADRYDAASTSLGSDLAATRRDLAGAQSELDATRSQLTTAQARIVELANEKAQVGDDREAQRLLADYQARVSAAAGRVALALDQCVKGQNQLIGYLATPASYDKAALDQYASEVSTLCTAATDANAALQTELGK